MHNFRLRFAMVTGTLLLAAVQTAQGQDTRTDPRLTEVSEPIPRIVTPGVGAAPPSDAIVLFDGADLSGWESVAGGPARWSVSDGVMTVESGTGNIRTKLPFGDVCHRHTPPMTLSIQDCSPES